MNTGGAESKGAEQWRAAVDEVEKVSPRAAPALKEAALLSVAQGEIAIQIPAGVYADTLEKRRAEIEGVFARFFGRPTRLAIRIGPAAAAPDAPQPAAPSIAATEAAEKQARSSRVRDAARNHPNIRDAAKILDGGIKDVEEL